MSDQFALAAVTESPSFLGQAIEPSSMLWRRLDGRALLQSVVPVLTTSDSAAGTPLLDSRSGNLFVDGGDANVSWYLPSFQLDSDDPDFAFSAIQQGVDQSGRPFNCATIQLALVTAVPADVQAAMAASPERTFQPIPLQGLQTSLRLTWKDDSNNERLAMYRGEIEPVDPTRSRVRFTGLLGPQVVVAFSSLTAVDTATIVIDLAYETARWVDAPDDEDTGDQLLARLDPTIFRVIAEPEKVVTRPTGEEVRIDAIEAIDAVKFSVADAHFAVAPLASGFGRLTERTQLQDTGLFELVGTRRKVAVRGTTSEQTSLPIAMHFAGPSFRPRFTVTVGAVQRSIVNADDLQEFHVRQSEYIEITALGDVATRYPTLRSLYLGQVSGTVIAVPALYGIQRGRNGTAMSCTALVDTSPVAVSGCRFHLSFVLAPLVDAGDLARLEHDLRQEPLLKDRVRVIALPSKLDERAPAAVQPDLLSGVALGSGVEPHTFTLGAAVVDDELPAVSKMNLVMSQLAAPTPTVQGQFAIELDDAFEGRVPVGFVIDLHETAGSDDVAIVVSDGRTSVSNLSPFALRVRRWSATTAEGPTSGEVDVPLAAAASVPIEVPAGAKASAVWCDLDLPPVLPAGELRRYLSIHAEDVQRVHHAVGFNAAGQIGVDIRLVSVELALVEAPDVALPTLVLTADHPIEKTAVEIPVGFALGGLTTTVALTVRPADGSPDILRVLTHDFATSPILTLTSADFVRQP